MILNAIHRNFVDIINEGTENGESYNIVERKREIFQRNIDGLNVTDTLMTMLSNTMSAIPIILSLAWLL